MFFEQIWWLFEDFWAKFTDRPPHRKISICKLTDLDLYKKHCEGVRPRAPKLVRRLGGVPIRTHSGTDRASGNPDIFYSVFYKEIVPNSLQRRSIPESCLYAGEICLGTWVCPGRGLVDPVRGSGRAGRMEPPPGAITPYFEIMAGLGDWLTPPGGFSVPCLLTAGVLPPCLGLAAFINPCRIYEPLSTPLSRRNPRSSWNVWLRSIRWLSHRLNLRVWEIGLVCHCADTGVLRVGVWVCLFL